MSEAETIRLTIPYGIAACANIVIPQERLGLESRPPVGLRLTVDDVVQRLQKPDTLPPLDRCVTSDDVVVLAVDPGAPGLQTMVQAVCLQLLKAGVPAEHIVFLQPPIAEGDRDEDSADFHLTRRDWPFVPADLRNRARLVIHDPSDETACAYLASSASGERLYLSRELIEADFVITIGCVRFDALLGVAGTNSLLYPSFSNADSVEKLRGEGHKELGPDDPRVFRELVDELGWLLGTQFTVQSIPAARGGVLDVVCGLHERVLKSATMALKQHWRLTVPRRFGTVVVAVDSGEGGAVWQLIATAIETATRLVEQDGRIIVLSDAKAPVGRGMRLLSRVQDAFEAVEILRTEPTADFAVVTFIANALQRARIYFLSEMNSEAVEDLFMVPVTSEAELQRLLSAEVLEGDMEDGEQNEIAIIGSAQNFWGEVPEW